MNIHARSLAAPLDYASIEKGIPARAVMDLIKKGTLAREDVFRAIPERTFKRRLAARGKLRLEEADAVARILRVNALAQWAFREEAAARAFLDLANPALKNRIPRRMAQTDAGAREVEALLHRFVYGDYS
jgi:putative toxin-antitoxin system antitoxin component (TIGR02293 family)